MAKAINMLLLGGVAFGIYYATRKTVGAKKLEFYPQSLDLSNIKLTNWNPDLFIQVVNPSYVEQSIDAVFLSIYSGTTQLGRIQITQPFKIPKLIDTVIKFPVTIFPVGAGTVIARLIRGEQIPLSIKGTIASMGVNIPIEQKLV